VLEEASVQHCNSLKIVIQQLSGESNIWPVFSGAIDRYVVLEVGRVEFLTAEVRSDLCSQRQTSFDSYIDL
jgi:hypothetical protein